MLLLEEVLWMAPYCLAILWKIVLLQNSAEICPAEIRGSIYRREIMYRIARSVYRDAMKIQKANLSRLNSYANKNVLLAKWLHWKAIRDRSRAGKHSVHIVSSKLYFRSTRTELGTGYCWGWFEFGGRGWYTLQHREVSSMVGRK